MKGILEFDLLDEQESFDAAVNATKVLADLNRFANELRKIWKYEILTDEQQILVDQIRDLFYEELGEHVD